MRLFAEFETVFVYLSEHLFFLMFLFTFFRKYLIINTTNVVDFFILFMFSVCLQLHLMLSDDVAEDCGHA